MNLEEISPSSTNVCSTKVETIGDIPRPQPNHQENLLTYATEVLGNMKDGDSVTFSYHQGSVNKTNRIDLTKGITQISSEKVKTQFSFSESWATWGLVLLIAIPWGFGVHKCLNDIQDILPNFTRVFKK
jgi:hypothetical protein